MKRRFFSADTLEKALMQAAREYQVEPSQVSYKVLEKRHGFLKIRRGVVIEVDPEAPEVALSEAQAEVPAEPQAAPAVEPGDFDKVEAGPDEAEHKEAEPSGLPETEPAEVGDRAGEVARQGDLDFDETVPEPDAEVSIADEASEATEVEDQSWTSNAMVAPGVVALPDAPSSAGELYPEATGELADAAHEGLERLFGVLDLDLEAVVLQGDDRLEIELRGDSEDEILAGEGELLLAIQHLLPRIMRGIGGRSTACRVDCLHFHELRDERLRSQAQDAADRAQEQGRPQTLSPMSPEERRIIHITLADDDEVETDSQGQGFFKRVIVRPSRGRKRSLGDNHNR